MSEKRAWEDFAAGDVIELGERTLSEEEIVEFARRWDPQPVYLDPAVASASPAGGLVASPWHPALVWARMYVEGVMNRSRSMGGPGMEDIRPGRGARPGERLRARLRILETWPSSKRGDRGTIHFEGTLVGDDDEPVVRLRGRAYIGRREPA
jgi:acyl dehydratase